MLIEYPLSVKSEIAYAKKWAYARNPAYYNFDAIGGDCTNFISQCLYAGGSVMNFTPDTGWFYTSLQNRAAAWTGVPYFYKFLTGNQGIGPFGKVIPIENVHPGDVIQLGNGNHFYHSLLVISIQNGEPYIATHTRDAFMVPLSQYRYGSIRCLHVQGARKNQ